MPPPEESIRREYLHLAEYAIDLVVGQTCVGLRAVARRECPVDGHHLSCRVGSR